MVVYPAVQKLFLTFGKVSYAHQGCIYLISNIVKYYYNLNIITFLF